MEGGDRRENENIINFFDSLLPAPNTGSGKQSSIQSSQHNSIDTSQTQAT